MSLILHVLKRMALVGTGYLLGLLAGLAALVLFYVALSALPGAPHYFSWVSVGSLLLLLVPPVALFTIVVSVYVTAIPMLVAAAMTEGFALRHVWLHMMLAALVGLCGFIMIVPTFDETVSRFDLADLGIVAAAGAVGGIVYWLVAGRQAGLKLPKSPTPLASTGQRTLSMEPPVTSETGTPTPIG